MNKLFIVGIPRDMDEKELVEILSAYGSVNHVTIITDKDTQVSKGYAFIRMDDQAAATRVITAMDGATIDDRTISVRFTDDQNTVIPNIGLSENKKQGSSVPVSLSASAKRTDDAFKKRKRPRMKS